MEHARRNFDEVEFATLDQACSHNSAKKGLAQVQRIHEAQQHTVGPAKPVLDRVFPTAGVGANFLDIVFFQQLAGALKLKSAKPKISTGLRSAFFGEQFAV